MLMMLYTVGGFVLSVKKPLKGSIIMISGGLIMAIYLLIIGGFDEIQMAMIYGLPFIIPGILFYYTAGKINTGKTELD